MHSKLVAVLLDGMLALRTLFAMRNRCASAYAACAAPSTGAGCSVSASMAGQATLLQFCSQLLDALPFCSQEKDRAKFGPEYGDRFCMLQLVGRHEMDKVQLQHESETVLKVRPVVSPA